MANGNMYSCDTCPKDDTWFANGGRCGWAHECKECSENRPPPRTKQFKSLVNIDFSELEQRVLARMSEPVTADHLYVSSDPDCALVEVGGKDEDLYGTVVGFSRQENDWGPDRYVGTISLSDGTEVVKVLEGMPTLGDKIYLGPTRVGGKDEELDPWYNKPKLTDMMADALRAARDMLRGTVTRRIPSGSPSEPTGIKGVCVTTVITDDIDEEDSPGQKQFDDKRKKRDFDRLNAEIANEEEKDREGERVSNAIGKTIKRTFLGWIDYRG